MSEITAYNSVNIDKELQRIKDIIDENDNYFHCKNPKLVLGNMISDIEDIFFHINETYLSE